VAEWIDLGVGQRARDEVEGQVEVGEREEGEEQRDELVHEYDVQENLARQRVVGLPDLPEMGQRVDGGEEGPIEPAMALRDGFGHVA
jgi:hypothetical protein